jgi:hypothetical protein
MSNEELTSVVPVSDEELGALFARAASNKIDSTIYSRVEARVLNQPLPPQSQSTVPGTPSFARGLTQSIDTLIEWVSPRRQTLWQPVLAASCPLVLGIVIGNFFHFGVNATTEPSFESWDDELVMLSFNDMTSLDETLEALEGETR